MPYLPREFLIAVAFVFGAVLGSFLNVVIARLPRRMSVVAPGSRCFACGKPIRWHDNLPILSWFFLRGRCRDCHTPFSIRCALVELAYALVCAFAVARQGLAPDALREMLLIGFLIPLAAIDLDCWLLPRSLTYPGIAVGLGVSLLFGRAFFFEHLLAAAIGYTALLLVGFIGERLMKKEALGAGDPPLLALIGAFLGLRALLPVIFFAAAQGALVGGALLWLRRRRGDAPAPVPSPEGSEEAWTPDATAIPFGPFLALAAIEVLYFPMVGRVLFPF